MRMDKVLRYINILLLLAILVYIPVYFLERIENNPFELEINPTWVVFCSTMQVAPVIPVLAFIRLLRRCVQERTETSRMECSEFRFEHNILFVLKLILWVCAVILVLTDEDGYFIMHNLFYPAFPMALVYLLEWVLYRVSDIRAIHNSGLPLKSVLRKYVASPKAVIEVLKTIAWARTSLYVFQHFCYNLSSVAENGFHMVLAGEAAYAVCAIPILGSISLVELMFFDNEGGFDSGKAGA